MWPSAKKTVVVGILGGLLCWGTNQGEAQAQPASVRAEELFRVGRQAQRNGELERAIEAYRESYDLYAHPATLLNLAICLDDAGQPAAAYGAFSELVEQYFSVMNAKSRQEAERRRERLGSRLARVRLRCVPATASWALDGRRRGPCPAGEPLMLEPGLHQFGAEAQGHVSTTVSRELRAGQEAHLVLALTRGDISPAAGSSQRLESASATVPAQSRNASSVPSEGMGNVLFAGFVIVLGALTWLGVNRLRARQSPRASSLRVTGEFPNLTRAGNVAVSDIVPELPAPASAPVISVEVSPAPETEAEALLSPAHPREEEDQEIRLPEEVESELKGASAPAPPGAHCVAQEGRAGEGGAPGPVATLMELAVKMAAVFDRAIPALEAQSGADVAAREQDRERRARPWKERSVSSAVDWDELVQRRHAEDSGDVDPDSPAAEGLSAAPSEAQDTESTHAWDLVVQRLHSTTPPKE